MYKLRIGTSKVVATYVGTDRAVQQPQMQTYDIIINTNVESCVCRFKIGSTTYYGTKVTPTQYVLTLSAPATVTYIVTKEQYISVSNTVEFTYTQDQSYTVNLTAANQIIYDANGLVYYPQSMLETTEGQFAYARQNNASLTGKLDFLNIESIADNAFNYSLRGNNGLTAINFPKVTSIGRYGCASMLNSCSTLTSIAFPELQTVGRSGLSSAFEECSKLATAISFPKLTTIEAGGMASAFYYSNISSLSFPELTTIGDSGCQSICGGQVTVERYLLRTISFPKLKSIGSAAFQQAFVSNRYLTGNIYFPCLTDIADATSMDLMFLNCKGISSVHFKKSLKGNAYCTKDVLAGTNPSYVGSFTVYYDLD